VGGRQTKAMGVLGMQGSANRPGQPLPASAAQCLGTAYNERALTVGGMSFAPRETTTVTTLAVSHSASQTFGTGSDVTDNLENEREHVEGGQTCSSNSGEGRVYTDNLMRYARPDLVGECNQMERIRNC
jgi:hypothetical protein